MSWWSVKRFICWLKLTVSFLDVNTCMICEEHQAKAGSYIIATNQPDLALNYVTFISWIQSRELNNYQLNFFGLTWQRIEPMTFQAWNECSTKSSPMLSTTKGEMLHTWGSHISNRDKSWNGTNVIISYMSYTNLHLISNPVDIQTLSHANKFHSFIAGKCTLNTLSKHLNYR